MSPEAIAELAALYAAYYAARGVVASRAAIAALDEAYLRLVPERDRDLVSVGAETCCCCSDRSHAVAWCEAMLPRATQAAPAVPAEPLYDPAPLVGPPPEWKDPT